MSVESRALLRRKLRNVLNVVCSSSLSMCAPKSCACTGTFGGASPAVWTSLDCCSECTVAGTCVVWSHGGGRCGLIIGLGAIRGPQTTASNVDTAAGGTYGEFQGVMVGVPSQTFISHALQGDLCTADMVCLLLCCCFMYALTRYRCNDHAQSAQWHGRVNRRGW